MTMPGSYSKSRTYPAPFVLVPDGPVFSQVTLLALIRHSFCCHCVPRPGDTVVYGVEEPVFHLSQGL